MYVWMQAADDKHQLQYLDIFFYGLVILRQIIGNIGVFYEIAGHACQVAYKGRHFGLVVALGMMHDFKVFQQAALDVRIKPDAARARAFCCCFGVTTFNQHRSQFGSIQCLVCVCRKGSAHKPVNCVVTALVALCI